MLTTQDRAGCKEDPLLVILYQSHLSTNCTREVFCLIKEGFNQQPWEDVGKNFSPQSNPVIKPSGGDKL